VDDLTIGQFMERTGVAEGTLRMRGRRHGFPTPAHIASGHRRYREADVELVRRVAAERSSGMSLAAAIARAKALDAGSARSVYATLRRRHPELEARMVRKSLLIALSHAIEDECLVRAGRPLLFGAFQARRFYRQEQRRWRQLARGAELAMAFADFERMRVPSEAPAEIPLDHSHPLSREWAVVCLAPDYGVCLSAWEPPGADPHRELETIWSVEPDVVTEAARICISIASFPGFDQAHRLDSRLGGELRPATEEQLRLVAAITNRMLAYLSR
jgi:DNA-binding transcriptional MerR regulator